MTEQITDRIEIVNADCYTLLDGWPSDAALVTDPPYGIALRTNYAATRRAAEARDTRRHAWTGREHKDAMHGDDRAFDPAPFLRFKTVCLWGANNYASRLPDSRAWLVWDKERPDDLDQATCELAWTNCVKGVRRFRHLWNGMMKASERGESFHPTQKPVALFPWTLNLRWLAGIETVFDPYMGSGPCGVACVRAGKRYVGVEINPTHFATARARLENELRQGLLPLTYNAEMRHGAQQGE